MELQRVERKLAAILSADAVGYSGLMAADEVGTFDTLSRSRTVISECVGQHGGRVVDSVGDNLLAEFPSVVDSVACAVQFQKDLDVQFAALEESRRLRYRVGIHLGDVIVHGDRLVGDGVNVAARIESLADAGGVTLSGMAFDQVEGKLPITFENQGERALKNLPRPVRVFRVRMEEPESQPAASAEAAVPTSLTVPGFSGRPAIVVLPFENLQGDSDEEYFAEGMAEDLITRLSRWRLFPLIARSSAVAFKGADLRQLREELGVGFVVSGSVRRGGDRVRIAAHLVDCVSGHQVWAERYDRDFDDVFALQDEISEQIVASLEPALTQFRGERLQDTDPQNLDAWDRVQCGWWHLYHHTAEGAGEAEACARRALELDGGFGPAHVLRAAVHAIELLYGWDETAAKSLEKLQAAASHAVGLDPADPMAHFMLGTARSFAGEHDAAIVAQERALDLNPSLAAAYWGLGVAIGASPLRPDDDGAGMIEKALRLSPHDPLRLFMLQNLGVARLLAGRHAEAADCARRSLQIQADQPHAWRLLAAAAGYLGREPEAREAIDRAFRLAPDSLEDLRLLNRPVVVEAILEGWRRAGWDGG